MRNLLIGGGVHHPLENSAPSLRATLEGVGIESDVVEDVEEGCRMLAGGSYDLLTFGAIRFRMLAPQYEQYRARWALAFSEAGREALRNHLRGGKALLAMHAASISFDDWPEWGEILGGRWVWGQSGHPPFGAVDVRFAPGQASPLTAGLTDFVCNDEVYGGLWIAPDVKPLAEARPAATDGKPGQWMPVLWAREWQGGRVVYDALGHDGASLDHPVHRKLITRAALWALGRSDAEVAKA
ncbi:MAG: ThuA domain-containing protein [Betaproteobacteria bacterium]|nr:ThuA domain-containing protein [Betaproteobacteria bacterium]